MFVLRCTNKSGKVWNVEMEKVCVCDSNTGVCVSGRSDSLESPFMAQIISRIREPGQSESVTSESNMFCLETHGGNVQQIQTSIQTLFKIQT